MIGLLVRCRCYHRRRSSMASSRSWCVRIACLVLVQLWGVSCTAQSWIIVAVIAVVAGVGSFRWTRKISNREGRVRRWRGRHHQMLRRHRWTLTCGRFSNSRGQRAARARRQCSPISAIASIRSRTYRFHSWWRISQNRQSHRRKELPSSCWRESMCVRIEEQAFRCRVAVALASTRVLPYFQWGVVSYLGFAENRFHVN